MVMVNVECRCYSCQLFGSGQSTWLNGWQSLSAFLHSSMNRVNSCNGSVVMTTSQALSFGMAVIFIISAKIECSEW